MKNIKEILIEKLILNKNSKKNYNVDDLNNDHIVLYDDQNYNDEEDDADLDWQCTKKWIDNASDRHTGFVVCRFNSLSKSKNLENDINDYSDDLTSITERICTGKDLGYEIDLIKGHLEYHCLNSGSRSTYYVYALSEEGYKKIEIFFDEPESLDGDDNEKLLFLFDEGIIEPIEDK